VVVVAAALKWLELKFLKLSVEKRRRQGSGRRYIPVAKRAGAARAAARNHTSLAKHRIWFRKARFPGCSASGRVFPLRTAAMEGARRR
jgi:hypothetical protein